VTPPGLPTLPRFIADRLSTPRGVALGERRHGRTIALRSDEVHRRAAAVAHALRARGIARGDRVAIVAHNRVDWLVADFGILYAGCVVVPAFATAAADHLEHILRDSEAKLVFTDDVRTAKTLRDALGAATPPLVLFEGDGDASFERFLGPGLTLHDRDPEAVARFAADLALDDLAVLIYTSGTTGMPKGVMLSHRNLVADAVLAFNPAYSEIVPGDVALSVLPFAHIYEHTNALGYLHSGAAHYVTTPDHLLEDMKALRPMHVAFVPRIFERLIAGIVSNAVAHGGLRARLVPWALEIGTAYERARTNGVPPSPALRAQYALAHALVLRKIRPLFGLDRAKYLVSGSAPLHKDTALALAAMGIHVCEGYGQTETAPVVSVNRPGDVVLGSVGTPIDGVTVQIADDGEVLVKGPNVMLGYYHVPLEEQPFTADGWLKTGDIGRLDERGHLYITDRKRELFKTSSGKWLSPARIETAIKRSVYIAQAVVFGDDRPHPGVLVVPNWQLLRQELDLPAGMPTGEMARHDGVRRCIVGEVEANTADLAPYEQVHRVGILPRDLTIEDGELSPTLKIKRRVVEERYGALIAEAYAEDLHARAPAT
jgi:long-chain acyl-CoA synthetase